jgi:hypothetical protein
MNLSQEAFAPGAGLKTIEEKQAPPAAESCVSGAAVYILFCVLSVLPFVLVAQPPIVDFANHAARLTLACAVSEPAVSAMYRYTLGIIPNLTIDLVNAPLCGLVEPTAVLRIVIVGALMMIYGAAWSIQRSLFGKPNVFLLMLPAIGFNLVTTMGYINFLAGVGVAMVMIACAIRRTGDFRSLLAIGNAGGVILFFCHIFALVVALIFFFGWLVGSSKLNIKQVVVAGLKCAAMFALPLMLIPFVASSGDPFSMGYEGKVRMLFALFMAQNPMLDFYCVLLFLPLWLAFRFRPVVIHPSFRVPIILLTLYVLLVPSQVQDAIDVDSRSLVALAYIFVAGVSPVAEDRRRTIGIAIGASALLAVHLVTTVTNWLPFSRNVDEFRAAAAILPEHAKILSSMENSVHPLPANALSYIHLASYATIDRRVFNPLEFSGVGMQPLSSTPAYAPFDTPAALPYSGDLMVRLNNPSPELEEQARRKNAEFALRWQQKFDFVIYYHFGQKPNFDPSALTLVHNGSFFSILAVKRPGASAPPIGR